MRRLALTVTSALALAALAGSSLGSAAGQQAAGPGDPYGSVWNILPPGSNGTATLLDLPQILSMTATATAPTNFADQLEMYDALTKKAPSTLTRADIDELYKRENFTPEQVVSTATPRAGVTIQRDQFGVPYITGTTYPNVAFGAGYAAVQDRMFLMDVLRHTGAARMVSFLGDTPQDVELDREQLASAPYTRVQAAAQVEKAAKDAATAGPRLLAAVDAFIAGINQAQTDMCPLIAAPSCPVEYAALQKLPATWDRADVVYVASLVGGIFGKGGGSEYANALWLQRLTKKFGATKGRAIYQDLREKNDLDAPTTATTYTPYGLGKIDPSRPGVAMPDLGGPTAPGSGDEIGSASLLPRSVQDPMLAKVGRSVRVALKRHGMSNAILLSGKHTASGKALAVMGPQTGYFAPQLLVEQVLMGPHVHSRGVSFAGANLVIQLGRGVDYAWSATSASNDNVDTVVEKLCNMDGSAPTVDSTAYLAGGSCRPMTQRTHTETALPNIAAPGLPKTYHFLVLTTRHGPVQVRTTVRGRPVALVSQRSTYGHEVDSVVGFAQLNDPSYTRDAASFQRAASHIDFTFNWFYADNRDISFFGSGLLPKRAAGVDFDLPRWGAAKYDWQGWLGFDAHAHQTNPARGYLVSWNNKEAPGFGAADDHWGYGTVYRSLALEDRLKRAITHGNVTIPDMVGVMSGAASADSRAFYTLPWLLKVIGNDPKTAEARRVLSTWLSHGAPRVDRDRDGAYGDQAAVALFDTWWEDGSNSVAYDVLKGRLRFTLTRQLPQFLDDHPRQGQGSSFNDVAWYGYVNKDLRQLLGHSFRSPYRYSYCGAGSLAACRTTLRASLLAAVNRVLASQGVSSVSDLTYDKTQDNIVSQAAGVVGVREIDWQNRPTFQQVIAFLAHRPR
jgi:acyl-homoserine lactone acylase PvdQ